jgi:hypothetical protein
MTIRFKCPNPECQKALAVKDELAGRKAPCPACKKPLTIPKPAVAAAQPAASAGPAVAPGDLEDLAAAALAGEPPAAAPTAAGTPDGDGEKKQIDFKCDFCDADLHAPAEEAGKKMQCTNPECRRIVKVPVPKVERKDWKDVQKTGPSGAKREVETLVGVQGGEVKRVSEGALEAAGVITEEEEPVTWGERIKWWLTRVVGPVAVLFLAYLGVSAYFSQSAQKRALDQALASADPKAPKVAPALAAELQRAAGDFHLRAGKAAEARDAFHAARGFFLQGKADAFLPTDRDWFLIDLAKSQVELGGNDDAIRDKTGLDWQDVFKELRQTLGNIKSNEAKAAAVREVGWSLMQKKQDGLAFALAREFIDENDPDSPFRAQVVALMLAAKQSEEAAKQIAAPTGKEDLGLLPRLAYAEGKAWEGEYPEALKVATDGKPLPSEKLEALLAVAAVAVLQGNKDDSAKKPLEAALPLENFLRIKAKGKGLSPLAPYQLARLAARADFQPEEMKKLADTLPDKAARARAQLEFLYADLRTKAKNRTPAELSTVDNFIKDKDTLAYPLAVEAIARHNTRLGHQSDIQDAIEGMEERFRPFAHVGIALGLQDRER